MTTTDAGELVPAVRFNRVSKTFPGGRALDDVTFDIARGRVHCLIGGNGSGKSTLVKGLAGVQSLDAGGTVEVGGAAVDASDVTPQWAFAQGVRFVHQDPGIFPDLTVADNLCLGHGFPAVAGVIRGRAQARSAAALLDRFEIDVSPRALMRELRLADQTMVAIARALQDVGDGEHELSLLVLDEPTAALPEGEVSVLLEAVGRAAAMGVGVLYISHRLEEILQIGDRVTVLRDSRHVLTREAAGLGERDLVAHIVGGELAEIFPEAIPGPDAASRDSEPRLRVRDLQAGPLAGVDLEVQAGEIVGIAGLLGSGRTELLRCLFGAMRRDSGTVMLDGQEFAPTCAAEAMRAGVAYVPEKREVEAAFAGLSVRRNISVADPAAHTRFGCVLRAREREQADEAIDEFAIRTSGPQALMSSLSGGNQQRVVLARWLRRRPRLVLLDEPTIGVDVGARADVYASVRRAVAGGAAVVLVSSDFEELVEMSDRVLVLSEGRVRAEVSGPDSTRHRLTELVFSAGSNMS